MRRRVVTAVATCLLAGILPALRSAPAAAALTVAQIEEIRFAGLYRDAFSLAAEAEVEVEAVGSGSREARAMVSYAWILDRRSREPVWVMRAEETEEARRRDNLRQQERLRLPAGDYLLFFSALGGDYPIEKTVRLLNLFDLGDLMIGGRRVRWNEIGTPSEWGAEVRVLGEQPALIDPPPGRVGERAVVVLDRIHNGEYRRARLDLTDRVRFRLRALGEYSARDNGFGDGAWISDANGCERIWEMTLVNTCEAGGAKKNRQFDERVALDPGSYIIHYASDDSHGYEEWNSPPPYDPDGWGITLTSLEPLAPGIATVTLEPPVENVIVSIRRVGDGQFRERCFVLEHPAELCVRAIGEWNRLHGGYFDYGWIEEAYTLRKIWTMASERGIYAAGEERNRLVEDRVRLEPGRYRVCYVTDDSHSYDGWSDHPPFDPDAWGIEVRGPADFSADWLHLPSAGEEERTILRLAPAGNQDDKRVVFSIDAPLTVRVICLGEGQDGEMYDYGWIEDLESGLTIWRMEYPDTHHAGGGRKNRRVERSLTLPPGRYALRYRTDSSHAFGDWNVDPPDDPHLWGITLIELVEGER